MSIEKSMKQFELDRRESVKIAARLLLASGTTSPRVGGVGECTIHIIDGHPPLGKGDVRKRGRKNL